MKLDLKVACMFTQMMSWWSSASQAILRLFINQYPHSVSTPVKY